MLIEMSTENTIICYMNCIVAGSGCSRISL